MNNTYYLDLHVHSSFSKGASPRISLSGMRDMAIRKGIDVLGTGDCLHPTWLFTLQKNLREDDNGMYYNERRDVYFIPTVEVSCEGNKKRVHVLLVFQGLDSAERMRKKLGKYGNVESSGRPVLNITPGELMNEVRSSFEKAMVIPAHVLTPYFGILGDKNNLESIYELMDSPPDAIETGLSADINMIKYIDELAKIPAVSFSDAHSLPNLGREVTMIRNELSWKNVYESIVNNKVSTIEFPPALGKYHYSGHSACDYSVGIEGRLVCRKCRKRVTMGVEHRVNELKNGKTKPAERNLYMVPLIKLISYWMGIEQWSRDAYDLYNTITGFCHEIPLLTVADLSTIKIDYKLKNLIELVRNNQLGIIPGFDGRYGQIVDTYALLQKTLQDANERYIKKEDYQSVWDRAEKLNELMMRGDMLLTQSEYEALKTG